MARDDWQRIKQVSMDALERSEAERQSHMSRACDHTRARAEYQQLESRDQE